MIAAVICSTIDALGGSHPNAMLEVRTESVYTLAPTKHRPIAIHRNQRAK